MDKVGVMSRRHNPQPTRVSGARTAIGAFLAAGSLALSPLAAPAAQADPMALDWLVELFTPAAGVATESNPFDASDLWAVDLYGTLHAQVQSWITSPLGIQIDDAINDMSGQYLIGNGLDGTATDPDGGDGGLWFGDGGDGYDQTAAGESGGSGGAARSEEHT